jgi:hypothetical protein
MMAFIDILSLPEADSWLADHALIPCLELADATQPFLRACEEIATT